MVQYVCDRCQKKFSKKHNYEIHINRKYPCTEINIENTMTQNKSNEIDEMK
jgi:protein involved in sex pheromone biosynthesis